MKARAATHWCGAVARWHASGRGGRRSGHALDVHGAAGACHGTFQRGLELGLAKEGRGMLVWAG